MGHRQGWAPRWRPTARSADRRVHSSRSAASGTRSHRRRAAPSRGRTIAPRSPRRRAAPRCAQWRCQAAAPRRQSAAPAGPRDRPVPRFFIGMFDCRSITQNQPQRVITLARRQCAPQRLHRRQRQAIESNRACDQQQVLLGDVRGDLGRDQPRLRLHVTLHLAIVVIGEPRAVAVTHDVGLDHGRDRRSMSMAAGTESIKGVPLSTPPA